MKKLLVTGGAGFIGSHVVDELVSKGYEVVVIDNLFTGKEENVNSKARFYNTDITDQKKLDEIFLKEKPEIVIHMAALVMLRKSFDEPQEYARVNINGTINVLESCKKSGVKRIIYTSTGGARYGEMQYSPIDEKHPVNPISPYGISKHTAEHYVEMYDKLYGLDSLTFFFGNVYGPRDDPKFERVIPTFISKISKGESPIIIGDGNQTRDFIYVEDVASLIVSSLEKKTHSQSFNLASGKQISINEIFGLISKNFNFNKSPNKQGFFKGEIKDIVLDVSLVKKELGWDPKIDIKEGISNTVNWFKTKFKY